MGAGTSFLSTIESRGAGAPSRVGGLEHSADPSAAAARVRAWGVRAMGGVAVCAFALIVKARITGNVRDRVFTRRGGDPAAAPPPPRAAGAAAAAGSGGPAAVK